MEVLRLFYKEKDLVVSATRHPKPISQVAENITVVTAKEIEEMNAHTVAEVLNRIPGLFVVFSQGIGSFGSTSLLQIQGSEERHVLVQVDGITWNFLNSGAAETNSIPVGIIERIEVIKGPASSAWGSALGGVVNIITKPAGTAARP
ncbi:MAG: TonB-dependent receptor, partial [Desulfobacca sp.]|nr:TonB-dependent receptor [Desulfobacca sp.]